MVVTLIGGVRSHWHYNTLHLVDSWVRIHNFICDRHMFKCISTYHTMTAMMAQTVWLILI